MIQLILELQQLTNNQNTRQQVWLLINHIYAQKEYKNKSDWPATGKVYDSSVFDMRLCYIKGKQKHMCCKMHIFSMTCTDVSLSVNNLHSILFLYLS